MTEQPEAAADFAAAFCSIGNFVSYRTKTLRGDAQLRARNKSCAIQNIGSRGAQSALLFAGEKRQKMGQDR